MGIRVHKVLGYGLTDIQTHERKTDFTEITDPRINQEGRLCADSDTMEDRWTVDGYRKFVCARASKDSRDVWEVMEWQDCTEEMPPEERSWSPDLSAVYDPEFGLPNVLVVVPRLYHKEWQRYDDLIDYTEESARGDGSGEDHVTVLPYGIHPFNAEWQYADSGEPAQMPRLRDVKDGVRFDQDGHPVVPAIPYGVRALCEYLNLFVDPAAVYRQMRPLLYVYWA